MSLFDLTEAFPSNFNKASSKHLDGADFPTFANVDKVSFPPTPTSGSSSTSPLENVNEPVTSPRTAGIRFRSKLFCKDEVVSAVQLPSKKRETFSLLFKPNSFTKKVLEAPSSSGSNVTSPAISATFSEGLYVRVDEYLDQQGLDIEMPSHANMEAQQNMAVRRLILARTVSEDIGMSQGQDLDWMSDDFASPSLRKNISSSSLLQRRATLSHISSTDLDSPKAPGAKKSTFHKANMEVLEEMETPAVSRRNSLITPVKLGELNTNFRLLLFKDTIGSISDLKSSKSRKQSIILSSFPRKPREEEQHVQSLTKLSPLTKPVPLAEKTASYFTPQNNFKRSLGRLPMNTPLTMIANKFRDIGQRTSAPKIDTKTTSIGEILSKSSESSPEGSIILN